jgi:DNA-binding NarL/FixJ family response regulator
MPPMPRWLSGFLATVVLVAAVSWLLVLVEPSGLELAWRLHRQANRAPAPVILISTHAEEDYAELIAAGPAIGFLPKTALSADAVRQLLALH